MKKELVAYLAAANTCTAVDPCDMNHYTKHILQFWANNHSKFPTWAKAARMVFSLSPNSAACERVFSLLKLFFGEQRDSALADQIRAALMLAYNQRALG
jgi:hypothetical protein